MVQEKFYFDNPNSIFKDESEEKIMQIFEDYLDFRLLVKDIEKKHDFKGPLRRSLPFVLSDEECRHCKQLLYNKPKRHRNEPEPFRFCPNCNHSLDDYTCTCPGCKKEEAIKQQLRDEEFKRKLEINREQWRDIYIKEYGNGYSFKDLTIYDEIDLVILFDKIYDDKEGDDLGFYRLVGKNIRYGGEYERTRRKLERLIFIANRLFQKNLLIPSGEVMITINESGELVLPNIKNGGRWIVNVRDEQGELVPMREIHEALINKEYTYEEKLHLMKDVFQSELMSKMNIETARYLKTIMSEEVIMHYTEYLFPKYSLAQSFQLVFYVVNNA